LLLPLPSPSPEISDIPDEDFDEEELKVFPKNVRISLVLLSLKMGQGASIIAETCQMWGFLFPINRKPFHRRKKMKIVAAERSHANHR
jgi:hypothetical protein